MGETSPLTQNSFATLRRFLRPRAPAEYCEFCSAGLAGSHQHLIEPEQRHLICVCGACAVLFSNEGKTKYRRIPRRLNTLPDFQLSDTQWESLRIPINLAFFFFNSAKQRMMVCYPSPGGLVEAVLDEGAWNELVQENPVLPRLEPDVEALLVNRVGSAGPGAPAVEVPACFLVPIDECFRLVGLIRSNWRGFSGGADVWREITQFFAALKQRAEGARA